MSHWTEIKTQIRDLPSLRSAAHELGLTLDVASLGKKVTARGYYNSTIECDAVVRLKGPYDVALMRQPDGTYAIQADYYAGHVAKEVGENCGKLVQLYGVHRTTIAARQKGYSVLRQVASNGAINLKLSVP
jgi:hypothetical protein